MFTLEYIKIKGSYNFSAGNLKSSEMSLADELLADLEEDDNDAELLLMEKQQDDEKRAAEMEIDQEGKLRIYFYMNLQ